MNAFVTRRTAGLQLVVACAAMMASVGRAASADDKQAPPAGLRVFYTGHSFHTFVAPRVEQLVAAAHIRGHKLVGSQGIGGSRVIQHWDLDPARNTARPALERGQVDVFTMAAHVIIPDAGITNFVQLGLDKNPQMRFLIQGSWFPFDVPAPDKRITDNAQRDKMTIPDLQLAIDAWRVLLEFQVRGLNEKHDRQCVFIVPVGAAVLKLREMIIAGTFPGITKQSELFRDAIGHGNGHVMALTSYCNYAAIYGRSPEGLNIDERGVNAAQHKILQQIAWETVKGYKYAGVSGE